VIYLTEKEFPVNGWRGSGGALTGVLFDLHLRIAGLDSSSGRQRIAGTFAG
jgi:hypothetical protein